MTDAPVSQSSSAIPGLRPCPFCGSEIKHVESWARSFQPNRLYHEWHHVADNEEICPVRRHIGKIVASATDDVEMQDDVICRWNNRSPQAQAGETYSGQTATNLGATIEVVGTISDVAQGWQDISTAPKDGTDIIVTDGRVLDGFPHIVYWNEDAVPDEKLGLFAWTVTDTSISYHEKAFTHWMPVPASPSVPSTNSGDAA